MPLLVHDIGGAVRGEGPEVVGILVAIGLWVRGGHGELQGDDHMMAAAEMVAGQPTDVSGTLGS